LARSRDPLPTSRLHFCQVHRRIERLCRERWYVDDIDQIVDELTAAGIEFTRYDAFEADTEGIAPRAGGGGIAWFQDPDGNTFAIEADT
jgi:catechol 2,3-dioxygenase-like lactoylglutathione lyase family enzyme